MKTHNLYTACATFAVALAPGLAWAQNCTTNGRQVVDAIYRQVLERNANGEGTAAVNQLANGQTTVRELVRNIANSKEHVDRFMSAGNTHDVTFAYKHLLGRAPDPGGLVAHEKILETEAPRAVVDNIIDSAEYQANFSDDTVPGSKLRYCGPTGQSSRTMRFQGMDANRNGTIERGEWNGSRGSFDVHDWNNDGVLSGEEIRVGGRRAARWQAEDDFNPNGPATWTTRNFGILDRNRDSRISSSEWYYAPEFFRRADRDRNGVLTQAEFTGGGTTWDDDRDDRFSNLDLNNNGRVERGEWHGSLDAFDWLDRNNDNWLSQAEVVGDTAAGNSTSSTSTSAFNAFQSLDSNRNGTLDASEWRWSLRSFERYDTNDDGRLTRQEFTAGGGSPTALR
jgi:hypothetical protein